MPGCSSFRVMPKEEKELLPCSSKKRWPIIFVPIPNKAPAETLVYLADTTGELSTLIQCADLALGGKTLHPNRGGQNPIEPIALGIPLVLGPNYQNFHQTCSDLLVHDAIRITTESAEDAKSSLVELAPVGTRTPNDQPTGKRLDGVTGLPLPTNLGKNLLPFKEHILALERFMLVDLVNVNDITN